MKKLFCIFFLLCSFLYKMSYSEEKKFNYDQHKEKLIEKKLLLNSFKKCEEYINETSVELFLNCSDGNEFIGKSKNFEQLFFIK